MSSRRSNQINNGQVSYIILFKVQSADKTNTGDFDLTFNYSGTSGTSSITKTQTYWRFLIKSIKVYYTGN